MDEMLGQVLGHYELVARLGSGGMGTVYRGMHQALQQPRAVKILRPDLANEPDVVARFRREATIAAGLHHPNVVLIFDVGEQDGTQYIVMELLDGGTLRDVIRVSGPLAVGRAVELLRPLAGALDYAHARGVVHRDVKPGNVMVGADGRVTLVDFGIARAAEEARLTRSGTLVGTAEYMAPEALTGADNDVTGDLYALGVVAYELLTGRVPFVGNPTAVSYAQVNTAPPSARSLNASLPERVERELLRQLAKSPADRFPDATSFVDALAAADGAGPRDAPTIAAPRPIRPVGGSASPSQPSPVGGAASPPPGSVGGAASPTPPSPTPRGRPMPPPPIHGAPESGTVFGASTSARRPDASAAGSVRRLAAFSAIVVALLVVGSVAIWQWTAGPATVAQATPAPAVTSAPTIDPTTAPATAPSTAGPAATAPSATAPAVAAVPATVSRAPAPTAPPPAAPATTDAKPAAPASPATVATSPSPAAPTFQTVFEERFADTQRPWPNNPDSTAWLADGVYRLFAREPGQFVSVGAPGLGVFEDVEVVGRFRKAGGPPGGGFGLIVRDQGPESRDGVNQGGRYYVLEVGEGTQYGIWRRETDHWVDIIPFTPSNAVRPPPEINELSVRAIGPRLIFTVNGVQVADVVDPALPNGKLGIYVAGDGNVVEAERFEVRAPR